jgi:hypothetical protein
MVSAQNWTPSSPSRTASIAQESTITGVGENAVRGNLIAAPQIEVGQRGAFSPDRQQLTARPVRVLSVVRAQRSRKAVTTASSAVSPMRSASL